VAEKTAEGLSLSGTVGFGEVTVANSTCSPLEVSPARDVTQLGNLR
jgi:hypothetical protein